MYEEMVYRNYSPRSVKTYIGLVSIVSKHFGKNGRKQFGPSGTIDPDRIPFPAQYVLEKYLEGTDSLVYT